MDDMLSQEEINALLKGLDSDDDDSSSESMISEDEKDAIGEVSNISMGTAATTLFSLVNQKVLITTPTVSITSWDDIVAQYNEACVAIQIVYKEGLDGTNLLILKEDDVKIIADLMMGGDGSNPDEELNELHLSAIGEAMNQMIGSAATSMSSMFHKKIDIAPPVSSQINLAEAFDPEDIAEFLTEEFIRVSFNLQIGDLVDSEMMQLYPVTFAKDIYNEFVNTKVENEPPAVEEEALEDSLSGLDLGSSNSYDQAAGNPMGGQGGMASQDQGMNPMAGGMNQQAMNQGMQGQAMNQGMMNQPMGGQPNMGMQGQGMNSMQGQGMMNQGMAYQNQGMMNQGMGYQNQGMQGQGMGQMQGMNSYEVQQAQFQNFDVGAVMQQKENIDLIMDVQLEVTVELGRTHKSIKDVLEFAPGTIIELNKLSGEPIDVLVNGKVVAKGEVVVIDENFSIRVTDIVK